MINAIQKAIVDAMKSKDQDRLLVLRTLQSDIKNVAIKSARKDPTDSDAMDALVKAAKQREDAIQQFTAANRSDLVAVESYQLSVVKEFLPQQMSESDVRSIVTDAIERVSAANGGDRSKKLMGPLMKELNASLKGKADMKLVNSIVATILT